MSSSPTSSSSSDVEVDVDVAAAFADMLDVPVMVSIVLGTGKMTVRQCLTIERNSIIRLEQSAGIDLHVDANGVTLARGEVVIVEDSTAIRITEIEPPRGESEGQ